MEKIKSRIIAQKPIKWRDCDWLQNNELKELSDDYFEKLQNSLIKNHYIDPFKVWKDKNGKVWILDGRTRKLAMFELEKKGYKFPDELPANFIKCKNRKEAAELVLVFNSLYSKITKEGLTEFLELNDLIEESLNDRINIEGIDLLELLNKKEIDEEKLDEVPEPQKEAVSKLGDIFLIDGKHRVMCGDSTKKEDVEKLMDGKKANLYFTDPPYGVNYSKKNEFLNKRDKGNRNQRDIIADDNIVNLEQSFKNIKNVLEEYSSYYIFSAAGGELMMMMMMMMENAGLPHRHMIVWVKNNHVLGRTDYNYKHEPIHYGWVKHHKFYGNGKQKFSVWNYDKPLKSELHPTMKPVALIENAILNSTMANCIVLDSFLGSGSTLIAAEQTNRICYGMEIDPIYIDVILRRYKNLYPNAEIKCLNRKYPFAKLLSERKQI